MIIQNWHLSCNSPILLLAGLSNLFYTTRDLYLSDVPVNWYATFNLGVWITRNAFLTNSHHFFIYKLKRFIFTQLCFTEYIFLFFLLTKLWNTTFIINCSVIHNSFWLSLRIPHLISFGFFSLLEVSLFPYSFIFPFHFKKISRITQFCQVISVRGTIHTYNHIWFVQYGFFFFFFLLLLSLFFFSPDCIDQAWLQRTSQWRK